MKIKLKSLNLIAFLRWNGIQIDLCPEEDPNLKGLYYAMIDEEILNKYLDDYRNDKNLHSFINVYKDLRCEIADRRRLED